ncbi:alpha/beta hydrolase [Salinarimonas soli]|uniref:Alpha/beta hydrolase n=1 Tax=Salinarimonas soli TaxID=1638099 RepID=A0A5B2VT19_9HYPH|nr:alpha/beta hydrolase [Salinarimonas soli]KAA2241269.1 alpha/beta hydrolase [Salinarimonas soli]
MAGIDYEAEYNNRARVPEHPAIIEGWARDAAAYREAHPPRSFAYGDSERQAIDLFAGTGEEARPLVMFIHGGYWQGLHPAYFSHLARGLNARGIDVAVPGYDLAPTVHVGEIVDQMRAAAGRLWRETGRRVTVAGHSAGGHLAACLLATDWAAAGLPADLVPGAYAISGLFELRPLLTTSVNRALGLQPAEADRLSPLLWPAPAGRALDAVVGARESDEYLRQSRTIAERWATAGVATRFEALPGADHFTVIAPLADPGSAMTARVAELARWLPSPMGRGAGGEGVRRKTSGFG